MRTHKACLTRNEFADLDARGAVVHWDRASVRRVGDTYVMEGPSGRHVLMRDATCIDRLNAHWLTFATNELNAYAA